MDDDFDSSKKFVDSSIENERFAVTEDSQKEPSYVEVFKNKNFMKLLSGQFFSNFGDAVFRVAIQLYVYEITLSITSMTLILAVQTLPWIIIGPIAGVFADRISRKALMIGADIVRGIAILALPFMSSIYGIAVIAFILGAASATFVAPRSAAIPEITGMRLYVKAISLSQLVFQTLAVIGPLFAAPLYIIFKASTFWITSGCFFVSAVILGFIAIPSASRDKKELLTFKTVLTDFKEGIVFLLKNKIVRLLILMFTFLIIGTAFAGPLLLPYLYEIRFNAISIQYFNTPENTFRIFSPLFRSGLKDLADIEYGYIGAIIALGSIIGNLSFGVLEKIIGRPLAIFLGSVAIACYYFAFLFQPGFIAILIIGFIMGVLNGMFSLAINALFAENVPNEVRGRAYSVVNAYIQVFTVICYSVSGITADSIGVVITMAGSGIFLLVTTALITIFTKFYRFANVNPQNASFVSK